MDYLCWDTESIRLRCIIAGFPISTTTADLIQNTLWELGVLHPTIPNRLASC